MNNLSLADEKTKIQVRGLDFFYNGVRSLKSVDMTIPEKRITAIIGPSGSGKSTLLRCIDRMHEIVPGARVEGLVEYRGVDIYDQRVDPAAVRRSIARPSSYA